MAVAGHTSLIGLTQPVAELHQVGVTLFTLVSHKLCCEHIVLLLIIYTLDCGEVWWFPHLYNKPLSTKLYLLVVRKVGFSNVGTLAPKLPLPPLLPSALSWSTFYFSNELRPPPPVWAVYTVMVTTNSSHKQPGVFIRDRSISQSWFTDSII